MSEDLSEILLHTPQTVIDGPDIRDHVGAVSKAAAEMSIDELLALPGLEEFVDGPSDQGQTGSCTAHAATNAYRIMRNRLFGDREFTKMSELASYNAARAAYGDLHKDEGMTVRKMQKAMREIGLCPKEVWNPTRTNEPPPDEYRDFSVKFCRGYDLLSTVTDESRGFPEGTDYSLRLFLTYIKVERLPIYVTTKIPQGDMRSSYVRRTGIRSVAPFRSYNDPGYWHIECGANIVRMDGRLYIKVIGSWGTTGDRGYYYIPFENMFNRYARGQIFALKKETA